MRAPCGCEDAAASALRRAARLDTDDHDAGRLRHTALTGHLRGDLLELQAPVALRFLAGLCASGSLCWQFANGHGHLLGLSIATQGHHHALSHRGLGDQRRQVVGIFQGLAVQAHDHIPPVDTRLRCWAARHHV